VQKNSRRVMVRKRNPLPLLRNKKKRRKRRRPPSQQPHHRRFRLPRVGSLKNNTSMSPKSLAPVVRDASPKAIYSPIWTNHPKNPRPRRKRNVRQRNN